jgi:arsenate reductase (thioredoxin)
VENNKLMYSMSKTKVLFVCIHNSARSQMAEAFLNTIGGDKFSAESAGLEPGLLNPLVVKSMKEIRIDISHNRTKDVFEFFKEGRRYDYVITVCDETSGERCPVFPGALKKIHWSFADPSAFTGTEEEKLKRISEVRDSIKLKIQEFINKI